MEKLSYAALKKADHKGFVLETAPEKVMQFGEGNFLRAFVNYWFDLANELADWKGKCLIIKPRNSPSGVWQKLNEQQGLYTLHLRGLENGTVVDRSRVISSVFRCLDPYTEGGFGEMMKAAVSDDLQYVVSNTTEAGIVYDPACLLEDRPADSFPGKLTQVLYARYRAGKRGLVILPCELNDNNADLLKECVLKYAAQWELGKGFESYLHQDCLFCNTLVDRIVPGGIREEAEAARLDEADGYQDALRVVGEVFGVWNIEGPAWLEEKLPFRAAGANCAVVPDVTPYKKRKVRILNGAHTGFVLGAFLGGYDIVRECMQDDTVRGYMNRLLYEEVIPTLPLDRQDLEDFAAAVQDRFNNPFVDHKLLSISLNSTSKWRARNLPSLLDYVQITGRLPKCLTMSFAAYLAFFTNEIQELNDKGLVCRRPKGDCYTCADERWVLEFYHVHRDAEPEALVRAVMKNQRMWGRDLTTVEGFGDAVAADLKLIREKGAIAAFASCQ